jgi:hypothetical protein
MNNDIMDAIGFLVVNTKTANGAIPLEGALVNIYENKNENGTMENGHLVYSLRTNSLGQSEKIALPTKNASLSTVPGNDIPYKTYNVFASKEGYFDSDVINAPIFQGVTSIQPITLIPLSEYARPFDLEPSHDSRFVEIPNTDL